MDAKKLARLRANEPTTFRVGVKLGALVAEALELEGRDLSDVIKWLLEKWAFAALEKAGRFDQSSPSGNGGL